MADINLGVGGANSATGGYEIDNSLKLEADNTEYLYYTSTTQTDYERMAFSLWIKRTELGNAMLAEFGNGTSNTSNLRIGFDSSDRLFCYGNSIIFRQTNQVFRDTSAWYHLFFLFDTTTPGGISNNRIRIWVNGEMIPHTEFGVINNPGAGAAMGFNNGLQQSIGAQREDGPKNYFNGYMAQVYGSGGTPPVVTDFGEVDENTGIWKPIDISELTPPDTQGFNLDFSDASNLGNDISTRNNNFTLQNITSADQATDTPTNNFCTINPLSYDVPYIATQGNTKWSKNDTTYGMASGTHYVGAGKWYWEIKATDFDTYSSCKFGIIDAAKPTVGANEIGYEDPSLSANDPEILAMAGSPNGWFMNSNSTISNNGATNTVDYTFNEGDILAFALDMDNGGYWMGNSRYQGVANGSFWIAPKGTSGSVAITDPTNGNYAIVGDGGGTNLGTPNFNGGTINGGSLLTAGFTLVTPLLAAYHANTTVTLEVNFGGFTSYGETGGYSDENGYGNFAYPVPSGFYCLCSKNIAEFGGTA
jgi:hypothetical protein